MKDADHSEQSRLFDVPATTPPPRAPRIGEVRLRWPERHQVEMREVSIDGLLPADHQARVVWAFVEGLDVSPLLRGVQAVEGGAGRPALDPRVPLALWLYATLRGVGSARELARLCVEHRAYQWLCGALSTNYHSLADFRVAHGAFLDDLLTDSVASLLERELVTMDRVAHDGIRVRASAGASSFHRAETLERHLAEAQAQVAALRAEIAADPGACRARQRAARERAAREREERVAEALAQLPEVAAKRKPAERGEARASTTDPDARVMKMADRGFRPAFNGQFVTDCASQVIVAVEVVNVGSDQGLLAPMVEQVQARYGKAPGEWLADSGYAKRADIEAADAQGVTVYTPVQTPKDPTRDAHAPLPRDSEPLAEWRVRMGTEEGKEIYKERASTAECIHAIARNRGLQQFRVRGLTKVRAVLLWYAVAHNLMRAVSLAMAG